MKPPLELFSKCFLGFFRLSMENTVETFLNSEDLDYIGQLTTEAPCRIFPDAPAPLEPSVEGIGSH